MDTFSDGQQGELTDIPSWLESSIVNELYSKIRDELFPQWKYLEPEPASGDYADQTYPEYAENMEQEPHNYPGDSFGSETEFYRHE